MKTKTIIAFVIWVINSILLLFLIQINYKIDDLKRNLDDVEKKVSEMRVWAEDIKLARAKSTDNVSILERVENLSKKYEISFESARPSGDYVEVVARGVEPSKAVKFIWELEQSGLVIAKLKLRKNISDANLNDIEVFIEQR